jgi:hypothetical protein
VGAGIEESFWLLMVLTIVTASIFLIQALRFKRKPQNIKPSI